MATECPLCGDEYEKVTMHISYSHTDEEYESVLLEELERLADEYDKNVSVALMDSEGKFSPDTYHNVFGSWNEALNEVELEVNKEMDITKEKLLKELQRLADEHDKTPSTPLMDSEGKFSSVTYHNIFGSWNEALNEAGLEVNKKMRSDISKKELTEELQRLANKYNKTPTVSLMTSKGKFSQAPYQSMFGSWNKALKEVGLEVNKTSVYSVEQSVYVLECGNGKYYVGASGRPDKRLKEHKNRGRDASSWAREHGVKQRIYLSDPMPHEEAYQKEREKTLELMREYGWQNVRGSQWLSVELESPPKPLKMNQKI